MAPPDPAREVPGEDHAALGSDWDGAIVTPRDMARQLADRMIGLFTRLSALILSGEMAFAYFISHAPHSFFPILNRGDAAILYCFIFLYFAFAGGGPWSLDAKLAGQRQPAAVKPAE